MSGLLGDRATESWVFPAQTGFGSWGEGTLMVVHFVDWK